MTPLPSPPRRSFPSRLGNGRPGRPGEKNGAKSERIGLTRSPANVYVCMCIYIYIYVSVYVCVCVCVCVYIYMCVYIYVCVYMCVCVYVCVFFGGISIFMDDR